MIEVLEHTGFKTPSEFFRECSEYDKEFIIKSLQKYKEKEKKMMEHG